MKKRKQCPLFLFISLLPSSLSLVTSSSFSAGSKQVWKKVWIYYLILLYSSAVESLRLIKHHLGWDPATVCVLECVILKDPVPSVAWENTISMTCNDGSQTQKAQFVIKAWKKKEKWKVKKWTFKAAEEPLPMHFVLFPCSLVIASTWPRERTLTFVNAFDKFSFISVATCKSEHSCTQKDKRKYGKV